MLIDDKEYLSKVYQKINTRLANGETQNKRRLKAKTTITVIVSSIIALGTSLTVYAALGGTIGGKPILDWFGIDFSEKYSEYVLPINNESIETNGAKLTLTNTVCDEGFTTFEFNLSLNEEAKKILGNTLDEENLVISFNDRTGISSHNNKIEINGEVYDIKSSRRHQQVIKISDYEYKIYQMYFLTEDELKEKINFMVTLDNISIVNMSEKQDFKERVRNYKKESETIEQQLYKSGSNKKIEEILKDYDDNSTYIQIKNDASIPNDFKIMLETAWFENGNITLNDNQTGLKTFAKNYKSKVSTIDDILYENNIYEDIETILAKYSDDITVDEIQKDYLSDYSNVGKDLSAEEYEREIEKINKEMSPERKHKRNELFTLLLLYNQAEGIREKNIAMSGNFNINLSKNTILKDTNIISQDLQTVNYKKMNISVDKVTVTPIQTIISLTSTINDISSNSIKNTNDKDYIGLIGYYVYDNNGNQLVNHQFEQKRTLILNNGNIIDGESSNIVNNLTFDNATMNLKNYISIRTNESFDSIKIVPYIQEVSGENTVLDSITVKLK